MLRFEDRRLLSMHAQSTQDLMSREITERILQGHPQGRTYTPLIPGGTVLHKLMDNGPCRKKDESLPVSDFHLQEQNPWTEYHEGCVYLTMVQLQVEIQAQALPFRRGLVASQVAIILCKELSTLEHHRPLMIAFLDVKPVPSP